MSTFKNISGGRLILTDDQGRNREILKDATFTGSNFFKRFVAWNGLQLVSDDGSVFPTGALVPGAGAVNRAVEVSVAAGTVFADNTVDLHTLIAGPARYLDIETDNAVMVRINEDTSSDFVLEASSIRRFDTGDQLVDTVQLSTFSGSSPATVDVFAIGIPE